MLFLFTNFPFQKLVYHQCMSTLWTCQLPGPSHLGSLGKHGWSELHDNLPYSSWSSLDPTISLMYLYVEESEESTVANRSPNILVIGSRLAATNNSHFFVWTFGNLIPICSTPLGHGTYFTLKIRMLRGFTTLDESYVYINGKVETRTKIWRGSFFELILTIKVLRCLLHYLKQWCS